MNYPIKISAKDNATSSYGKPLLTLESLMAFMQEAAPHQPYMVTVEYNARDNMHRPVCLATAEEYSAYCSSHVLQHLQRSDFYIDPDAPLLEQFQEFFATDAKDADEEAEIFDAVETELKQLCEDNDDYIELVNCGVRIWE